MLFNFKMQFLIFCLVLVSGVIYNVVNAGVSDYFRICHRSDPNLSGCVKDTLQQSIATLKNGVSELDLPPIEPLPLERIQFKSGSDTSGLSTNLTNIFIWGLSNTQIIDTVAQLSKRYFNLRVKLKVPLTTVNANYEMDTKILFLALRGKGSMQINGTDVLLEFTSKAERISRNGEEYMKFGQTTGTMEFGKARLSIEGLFKDPVFNKATNEVINDNFYVLYDDIHPFLLKALCNALQDMGNKATNRFTLNELLPK